MATLMTARSGRARAIPFGQGLLQRIRFRARRQRNLAELRALDAERLEDIGLNEWARARITG